MKLGRIPKFAKSRNCCKDHSGTKKDEIYHHIPLKSLKGVAGKIMEMLNVPEIMPCGLMCDLLKDMLESVNDFSKKTMLKFQDYAQNVMKLLNAPTLTDYCKHYNQYMSIFNQKMGSKDQGMHPKETVWSYYQLCHMNRNRNRKGFC